MRLTPTTYDGAPRRVLLSSTASDSHTWNLVFLQLLLEEHGHHVINLGPCTPDQLVIEESRRHAPDVLVLSTVNGHGSIDGARLIRRLRRERDLRDLPVVIGGKLGVRGDFRHGRELLDAGFNAVFEAAAGADALPAFLQSIDNRALIGRAA